MKKRNALNLKKEKQIKKGYNKSGTQRCKCKDCGITYAIDPKQREYPEETKELVIKIYYSGVSAEEWTRVWE